MRFLMMKNDTYIESVKKQMFYYKTICEKAMEQLEENQLFYSTNEDTNSIATIIQHLSGNMISRWTDFLSTDGEKEWRNRDSEFETNITTREDLIETWNNGWNCFFTTINSLQSNDLEKTIYIRKEGQTVIDAINRQLAHYPYHIGQIVFIAKMIKQNPWTSLSIAKNKSNLYNADKFSKERTLKHFTDDELKKLL